MVLIGILHFGRNLRLGSETNCMPPLTRVKISSRRVSSDSVVPNNNTARLIPRTNLEVCTLRNVVEQEFQEVLRFLRLVADDAAREKKPWFT